MIFNVFVLNNNKASKINEEKISNLHNLQGTSLQS